MSLTEQEVNRFKNEILEFSEYDFTGYSVKSFTRRLDKILNDNKMSLDSLLKKMEKNNTFLETVVKEITVNTTEPFRTPNIWKNIIPLLEDKYRDVDEIKIWHAGCSNGLEVYSMLILLYEMRLFDKVKVFGSDLNEDMLEIARSGKYRLHDFDEYWHNFDEVMKQFDGFDVKNYLDKNTRRSFVKMKSFLIEKPDFIKQDLINDGNIFSTNFDIIMCRNVLIYFNHELQNEIFNFFHKNLNENGMLIIGKHESILSPIQHKFERIDSIYIKKKIDKFWDF
ncbi:MAG: CheR family methyltransferase [Bacteroidota bacterium]|nr:CheR family methyltransferase [Bacteroidota bacterium]